MNKKNEAAKDLLEKVREIRTLSDDPRIEKKEITALDFIGNANWDLLQAMSEGVHHKQEFDFYGIKVYLRLLCSREERDIMNDLYKQGYVIGHPLFQLEKIKYILSKASTKHPELEKDEQPTLSLATLDMMPYFMIEALGDAYTDFCKTCNLSIDGLDERQVKEVVALLEAKPAVFKDLPYIHKEQIISYLIKQYQTLMQQVDKLLTQ